MKNYFFLLLFFCFQTGVFAQDAALPNQEQGAQDALELRDLIYNYIRFPEGAKKAGMEGVVKVVFSVLPSGQITNIQSDFLGRDQDVAPHEDDVIVMGKAFGEQENGEAALEQAILSMQSESLMVFYRMRRLPASEKDGKKVMSSREVTIRYVLE